MSNEPAEGEDDDDDEGIIDFDSTDFPPPHSAVHILTALARKHGLIKEDEYISQQMRDFLADVVEECAKVADQEFSSLAAGQRVRMWMAPESLEEARQLELEYERDFAASMERLEKRQSLSAQLLKKAGEE
ncbi:hypothetical protein IB236_12975 [Acidovorax sp. ACV02]|uniref:hypothetical protein n=1 Tax=Acidovorax sp. ACV02 TaxID=2769310 RepID=UPI001785FCE0|nr:hypothetical protein [Acidovorax sp. ACV02]MBD9406254.1 hypothetical protein [Acidovorax sp. ACV02]